MKECKLCDGSGLIPFKNKEGKVVPHTFAHCDCHPIYGLDPNPEPYQPSRLVAFDFPCSNSYRGYYFEQSVGIDPGYVAPEPDTADVTALQERIEDLEALIASRGQMPRKYHDDIHQLKAQMIHLQSKVIGYQAQKKKEVNTTTPGREDITDKVYR